MPHRKMGFRKLQRANPEYLIENLASIERVAELIYDRKDSLKRKRVEKNVTEKNISSESEESDEEGKKDTVKKQSEIVVKRAKKDETCNVGFCGDETKEHICKFKRELGVQTETTMFGPHLENDRVYYFDTIWQRLFYQRLFQTNTEPFNNLELHDITIHLKLTTYHATTRCNTHNLPTKQDNTVITTLLSPMTLHFHIVEICDLKLAKKENPQIDDLLVDNDLKGIQFKDSVKSRLNETLVIDCSDCQFTYDKVVMCIDLKKLCVCVSSKEEGKLRTFDKANYTLVIIVDYMDWMDQFKRKASKDDDAEIRQLGMNFNSEKGTSVFLHF
ncbi:hypothetical protein C2G38_2045403 [Gigaspora rosea]|uniref:Uncharacterized protein n=1 Tax=Gigaspora rosea TaxID=44941 RepID=A0A397UCT7_9GLOM|nr:hypothetical protein C2G38_2045403 [Gigaspora rosea]